MTLVDEVEGLEAGDAGHVLVEEHEREGVAVEGVEGVAAVGDGGEVIAFGFEEEYVGLEEVNLVVCPENLVHIRVGIKRVDNKKDAGEHWGDKGRRERTKAAVPRHAT